MNAIEKLTNEKANAKSNYEKMVADALIKRCKESTALPQNVMKPEKTLEKCFKYIKDHAQKEAKNGCAVIEDGKVYEWAEDYYYAKDEPKPEPQKFDKDKAITKATANTPKSAPKPDVKATQAKGKATVVAMPKKPSKPTSQPSQSKPKAVVKPLPAKKPAVKENEQFSLFDLF